MPSGKPTTLRRYRLYRLGVSGGGSHGKATGAVLRRNATVAYTKDEAKRHFAELLGFKYLPAYLQVREAVK